MKFYNGLSFELERHYSASSRNFFLTTVCLLLWNFSFSQEEDIFKGELSKIQNEVKSPESWAFETYGSPNVNMYTGTPQISIPLHTLKGREFSLPLSLVYDATGVKVDQMATWVGLSWNLNMRGRISRVTNGLPDDYIVGYYSSIFNDAEVQAKAQHYINEYASSISNPKFPSPGEAEKYLDFLYDINFNRIETQVDYFRLVAPGINETIVLEKNDGPGFTAKALNNPRIKIQYTTNGAPPVYISSWTVTNEDGTEYKFQNQELTYRQNLDADEGPEQMGDPITEYVSAWLLTKITSKNGKDIFDITYVQDGYEPQRSFSGSVGSAVTNIIDFVYDYPEPPLTNFISVESKVKQSFPFEVWLNSKKLVQFNLGARRDVDNTDKNKRLASMDFFDWNGNTIRFIEFDNNHYFNADGLSNANIFSNGKTYTDIRLKLDGLTIKGKDNNAYENYFFEYIDPDGVPSRTSLAQDYYGYYNGAGNNNSLYEGLEIDIFSFAGADRQPNTNFGKKGTLQKITYPTGGYTEFSYESHQEYSSTVINSEESILYMDLSSDDPPNPELYSDGEVCDDLYLPPNDPWIAVKTFVVLEGGEYELSLVSNVNSVEFYLVDGPGEKYCDFVNSVDKVIQPLNMPMNQPIDLVPGKYKALLLLGNPNDAPSATASVKISRPQVNEVWSNKNIGGQRIAEIRDFNSNGTLSKKKIYGYNDEEGESTAEVNYRPVLHSLRENNTEDGPSTQLVRYATSTKGSEPYVVYSSITESIADAMDTMLGTTRYNFYYGSKGSVPMPTPPYENWFFPNISVGNPSSKTISIQNNGEKKLVAEDYGYYETLQRPISIKSLVVYVDNDNFQKTIFLKEHNKNTPEYYVSLEYLDTWECEGGADFCAPPPYYLNPPLAGYHSRLEAKYSPYKARISKTNGAYGGLDYYRKESKFYDINDNLVSSVTTEENTVYDQVQLTSKYLPKSKTVLDSKGNAIETEYFYPHQGVVEGSNALVSQNNLVEVVKTQTTLNPDEEDEKLISILKKDYVGLGGAVMPATITTQKGSTGSVERGEFTYYSNGNIKSSNRIDGPETYYIWGYDSQFPIAEIYNFHPDDITDKELKNSILSLIEDCEIASDADDGTQQTENSLRTAQNLLRSALPNSAQMKSYTYDPVTGLTSITDARGNTTFFEYDEFNRFKNTKDNELNLLNDYQYHYKGQN